MRIKKVPELMSFLDEQLPIFDIPALAFHRGHVLYEYALLFPAPYRLEKIKIGKSNLVSEQCRLEFHPHLQYQI